MTSQSRWGLPIELGDQRFLHEDRLLWLRAIAWMVALFFAVVMSFGPVMSAVRGLLPTDAAPLQFLARCAGAAVALGAYALLVRFGEGRWPREIALRPAPGQLLVGIVLGLAMFALVMAVMIAFGLYDVAFVGPASAWRAAGLAIEAGVIEELMIRGIVLRLLWRAFGPAPAFLVSAALFGAGHLPNSASSIFAALCIAVEAGVMLGALYALTGRLWMPIGVHIAWNFAQGYLFGAAVSGGDLGPAIARSTARPGVPEWLTGGAFGPEGSLPALLVCGTVGAVALWLAWKEGRFARKAAAAIAQPAVTAPADYGFSRGELRALIR
ncbi:type II CAAX endopeptidase family protein [Sphingomonas mucosissima]|uniref:CAAX amino terminal protease self-immunity n=1 Tax=Sphingomonas mucosissima TaxID=370959 RepID=A0A245ZJC3_9SPHN|nr:type II CAAX endopeptidase family protein [Sphingomonas mucosissima]OWK29847.1 CAAX amino terminal protease self- immunity [Sphingomonas mucosissima]